MPSVSLDVNEPVAALPTPVIQEVPIEAVRFKLTVWQSISVLWAIGLIFWMVILLFCWIRFWWRFLRESFGPTPRMEVLLSECGNRRARLALSEKLQSPVVFGLFRPTIIVPIHLADRLSEEELKLVFLHELGHVRRWDIPVQILATVLLGVHWWNPMLWFALRQLRHEAEAATDAWVLAQTGNRSAPSYSEVLLSLATSSVATSVILMAIPGLIGATSHGRLLRSRIKGILNHKAASFRVILAGLVLFTGLGIVSFAESVVKPDPGSVAGIVVDEAGIPLADAKVVLYWKKHSAPSRVIIQANSNDEIVETVRSDATGKFGFTKPLQFDIDGPGRGTSKYLVIAKPENRALVYTELSEGHDTESIRLVSGDPIDLTWTIKDTDGTPLAGVHAEPDITPKGSGLVEGVSDASGKLSLKGLPRENTRIRLRKGTDLSINYFAADSETGTDLIFDPGLTVTGRVVDPDGKPVPDALVWFHILWEFDGYDFMFNARTGPDGRYRLDGLYGPGKPQAEAKGDFTVWVEHARFAAKPRQINVGNEKIVENVDFEMTRGTMMSGRFLGLMGETPLPHVQLQVFDDQSRFYIGTDDQGRYKLALPEGRFHVLIEEAPRGYYVKEENVRSMLVAKGRSVETDLWTKQPARKTGSVQGLVTTAEGSPAVGVTVTAATTGDQTFLDERGYNYRYTKTVKTDASGTFKFNRTPSEQTMILRIGKGKSSEVATREVKLGEGHIDIKEPIVLKAGQKVDFLLTDFDGNPLPKYRLGIEQYGLSGGEVRKRADENGFVSFNGITPGTLYTLSGPSGWVPIFKSFSSGDQQRHTVVLSKLYVLRAVNAEGETVPIREWKRFRIWGDDGESNWAPQLIERFLPDGGIAVRRNIYPFYSDRMEIDFFSTDSETLITAEGEWPKDGTNVAVLRVKSKQVQAVSNKTVKFQMRLVDAQTGNPVSNLEVTSIGSEDNSRVAVSDESGIVNWEGLQLGESEFRFARKAGAVTYRRVWSKTAIEDHWEVTDRPLTMNQGAFGELRFLLSGQPQIVDVKLERGVRLFGQITRADSSPVDSAAVRLIAPYVFNSGHLNSFSLMARTTVNKGGYYEFFCQAGNGISNHLLILPTEEGSELAHAISQPFDSRPGDEVEINIVINEGGRLSGRVEDEQGRDVTEVAIHLRCIDGAEPDSMAPKAVTDSAGEFDFKPLRAGRYQVAAYRPLPPNSSEIIILARNVTVKDGESIDLGNLTLKWRESVPVPAIAPVEARDPEKPFVPDSDQTVIYTKESYLGKKWKLFNTFTVHRDRFKQLLADDLDLANLDLTLEEAIALGEKAVTDDRNVPGSEKFISANLVVKAYPVKNDDNVTVMKKLYFYYVHYRYEVPPVNGVDQPVTAKMVFLPDGTRVYGEVRQQRIEK